MVRIAFIHPDLGIGGAERLVVDAALALKSKGHVIDMFTAHHDHTHCFQETKDGTLNVHCVGDWLPRHFIYKGYALFAYIRMIYVAIYLVFFSKMTFDVIICDQISACIPVLRWSRANVVFYCHFPDQLLTQRKTWLKKVYRCPIDTLEEKTTGMANIVLVNSKFTSNVFHTTFKSLSHVSPTVLYPSLNFTFFDQDVPEHNPTLSGVVPEEASIIFLSINRYERKKNLSLAVRAFEQLVQSLDEGEKPLVHLIMAGGYDERVVENKEYYSELKLLAEELEVSDKVTFFRSFSDVEKIQLLKRCSVLIYTPSNEHFGICPLEAMYMERPVIAVNNGGPLETVLDGETGFLCEPTPKAFAEKMLYYVRNFSARVSQGKSARDHVVSQFSFNAFTTKLDSIVSELMTS